MPWEFPHFADELQTEGVYFALEIQPIRHIDKSFLAKGGDIPSLRMKQQAHSDNHSFCSLPCL
jgi:hypothetical protein